MPIKFIDGFVVYQNKLASNMINVMALNTRPKKHLYVIYKCLATVWLGEVQRTCGIFKEKRRKNDIRTISVTWRWHAVTKKNPNLVDLNQSPFAWHLSECDSLYDHYRMIISDGDNTLCVTLCTKPNYENEYFQKAATKVFHFRFTRLLRWSDSTKEPINGVNETLILKPTTAINHFTFRLRVCRASASARMYRHIHASHPN